jgi:predicted aconitase
MNRLPRVIATLALTLGSTIPAASQEPIPPTPPKRPAPEDIQKSMDAAMGAMVPMMGRMTEATIEAQLAIAERPGTAERIAVYKKNLFEAYKKQGFTVSQALQLTLATPLPSASMMAK